MCGYPRCLSVHFCQEINHQAARNRDKKEEKPATESTLAQERQQSQTLLFCDQKCKSHLSALSALFAQTPGYSPMGGTYSGRNNGNNRVKPHQRGYKTSLKTPIKPGYTGISSPGVKRRLFTLRGRNLSKPHKPLKTPINPRINLFFSSINHRFDHSKRFLSRDPLA